MRKILASLVITLCSISLNAQTKPISFSYNGNDFEEILFIERDQYARDHHNTATMFQKGEINESSFKGGSAMKALNIKTGKVRTILASKSGIIRDPELSFDASKIIFSMRNDKNDFYHIYEINTDGTAIKQLTFAQGISDIDPLYLPDGDIVFSSTREPKFCMCNRHIMCNMYRMEADGANITQIGKSTLFEGHSSLMNDGRVLYDRWEYVDRNFGDAQGLWVVNPDGTKHSIYYGNNTSSPGGVIDARQVIGSDLVVAIFGGCHDRPWGAMALIDRKRGIDGEPPVIEIWPDTVRKLIGIDDFDAFFNRLSLRFEDPFPLSESQFIVSKSIRYDKKKDDYKMGIYLAERGGKLTLLYEGTLSTFDPQPITPRFRPNVIPAARGYNDSKGLFYVQNVYEGTHMQGVEKGAVKYLRVIESPEKKTWTQGEWGGQGVHCPAMNWSSFELKKILGEVEVQSDGSAYFEVPQGTYLYFQLLDKDKKMIQSMRSGVIAHSGEVNGCIGCHEDRINVPITSSPPTALKQKPAKLNGFMGQEAKNFSYVDNVQPIFDKHCVTCHDFDNDKANNLILAGDKNPFFNASYIELYVKNKIKLIEAGPAEIQKPYSWGAHASLLTQVIDNSHHKVSLTQSEKQMIYAWLDINGTYYPTYESAYPNNFTGRCPLTNKEIDRLCQLTGKDIYSWNSYTRDVGAMISFDRPEKSPMLNDIRGDKTKLNEAITILSLAQKRLQERPRGDIEHGFVPCEWHLQSLEKYRDREIIETRNRQAIDTGKKVYDK